MEGFGLSDPLPMTEHILSGHAENHQKSTFIEKHKVRRKHIQSQADAKALGTDLCDDPRKHLRMMVAVHHFHGAAKHALHTLNSRPGTV